MKSKGICGDDLYELIDNEDCTSISEFAEEEEELKIAGLWSFMQSRRKLAIDDVKEKLA